MITLTIIVIIVLFEVYYIYSEESHEQFFEYVGVILVMIFIASAYCLFACLKMKTSYVERFTVDNEGRFEDRRGKMQKEQLHKLCSGKKF